MYEEKNSGFLVCCAHFTVKALRYDMVHSNKYYTYSSAALLIVNWRYSPNRTAKLGPAQIFKCTRVGRD